MDSALTPREIQSRIRAGESPAQVAEAAGVPLEQLAPFTAPVMAEREHIVALAKEGLVRRRGDGTHRPLLQVIEERLFARRLDPDDLLWDSYRLPTRAWRVSALLDHGEITREALFTYDPRGRYSVADNADARWMIGEDPPPGVKGPDQENTVDLNDEMALVRATQDPVEVDEPDYVPAEIAEVDGLYDIVGPHQSQLDVLYEMLSGISEDSVRIYQGLVNEEGAPPDEPAAQAEPEAEDPAEAAQEEPEELAPAAESPVEDEEEDEPTQDALIGDPDPVEPPKPKRRRRASVPTWDDILFGSPKKD